ncbi:multicopper oxidase family protein [Nocardia stercoris]|uniref:Multicopper oxidase family protein n=2 Tax=Nocardia stercoris TaxID=2483361 RepID=A0A3M2KYS4_9NOCA|nr:multicopper oxidase family protein [Nocardia stercoris]
MTAGQALQQPPEATGMTVTLDASAAKYELAGRTVEGNEYNGGAVAPTLRAQPGSTVTLTLVNHLPVATNLHFHGLHIAPTGDSDDPDVCVAPGATHVYRLALPANHPMGTYWYHSHAMGLTCPDPGGHDASMPGMSMPGMSMPAPATFVPGNVENQIFAGLSGALIVGDDRAGLPEPLRGITAQTLVLKDVQLDPAGRIVQGDTKNQIESGAPTVRLVNGQLRPVLTMRPGETQLWRLVNAGADIFYDLRLAGYTFTVIGEDGIPVAATSTPETVLMPPGKRYDVLVTAAAQPGQTWLQTMPYSNGPQGDAYPQTDLIQVRIDGDPVPAGPVVSGALPGAPADLANAPIAWRRSVQLSEDESGTSFFVNGKQFSMGDSIFTTPARLGTVEEWTLTNVAGEDHPFHLHTSAFQVVSINGVTQPYTHRQDTVLVPHQENDTPGKVVIRIPFDDYPGHWMFHCHIAAHEDNGMMSYVNVVK